MEIVFIDCETEKKLRTIKMTVMILGMSLVNPWLYLSEIVKQISKKPARSKKIQAVDINPLYIIRLDINL